MTKPNINVKKTALKVVFYVKVSAVVVVLAVFSLGAYVLSQPELRNHAIDYAQGPKVSQQLSE